MNYEVKKNNGPVITAQDSRVFQYDDAHFDQETEHVTSEPMRPSTA